MNARKLPSGNFRARVFDHTDVSGRKHYVSFTAPTKKEAEKLANQYIMNKERLSRADLSVAEAVDGYISSKENVLSPSTIREYRRMQKKYYDSLNYRPVDQLTSEILQRFVSGLTVEVAPKTVSNVYGLLTAAVALFRPDKVFRVTLPRKPKKRKISPSDEDIRVLYDKAEHWMKLCIALAAFGSLRRGEIPALRYGDIEGNRIHVHADWVKDQHSEWVLKEMPKTSESDRYVMLPEKVIKMMGKGKADEFIVKNVPDSITKRFIELRDSLNLTVKFHDLRHYYASIGAAMGIPDIYMADFGGWRQGSSVMKEIYQNKITPISDQYAKKLTDHFEGII